MRFCRGGDEDCRAFWQPMVHANASWFVQLVFSVNYNVYYFIRHANNFFIILYFNLVMTCTIIEKLFTFKFDMCLGGHWEKKRV